MRVPIVVDRGSDVPLHRQIYEGWRDGILARRFRGGDKVPSTRELAGALGLSRATVTAAYEQLSAEGYFETMHGAGTFVCRELPDDAPTVGRKALRPAFRAAPVALSRFGQRLGTAYAPQPSGTGLIDLSRFGPDLETFPLRLWRRLLVRHLRDAQPPLFAHGGDAGGYMPLRRQIAAYLARSRAVHCDADQVIVVNGSQQALDISMRLLVDTGDEVALEDPGYPGARQLALAHGARVQPVRVTSDGLHLADLRGSPRLVHVTPSHQFPKGASMSLARRLELLEWARRRGTVIIEDDYDSEYRYSGPPLPALQGLADGVPVVYVGTFSNVMFRGIRIGYVVVPRELVAPFTRAKWLADRQSPLLDQAALAVFMGEGHLERHVRRMRRLYRSRREALVGALERHLGDDAVVHGDAAGMHALVGFRVADVRERARRHAVRMTSADPYYLSGRSPNEFILGFAAIDERTIVEGVKRLALRVS
jgi:GntR family transcriptional regulator/MocR family aminotransferase